MCEIAPKRNPSDERSYIFEYTCESVFSNRVALRAKLDPSKFAIPTSHLQNDLTRDRKDLLPGVSIAFCHAAAVFYTFSGGYAPVRTILGLARP
jgi:hypothetical protein